MSWECFEERSDHSAALLSGLKGDQGSRESRSGNRPGRAEWAAESTAVAVELCRGLHSGCILQVQRKILLND